MEREEDFITYVNYMNDLSYSNELLLYQSHHHACTNIHVITFRVARRDQWEGSQVPQGPTLS